MITDDYVSFETAKLLKEKGFTEFCFKCYGVAVLHNGADISFDEECDLKDYGREDEIEYVEGGRLYDCGCNNRDKDTKVWAAPTLWVAMKWLREVYDIHPNIVVDDFDTVAIYRVERIFQAGCDRHWFDFEPNDNSGGLYNTYEDACEAAIKYCLENLI